MRAAKAGYFMIIVLSALAALILYTYGDQISWLHDIPTINNLCTNNGQSTVSACFGASAVLRISLGLTIFFTVALLTSFSSTMFAGLWGPKVLIWLICIIGCIFVPSDAIEKYGATARIFALGFLVAQIILLIDFAYHLHERLLDKIEATQVALREKFEEIGCCQNMWRWLYVVLVVGLLLASIIGLGIMYHFSANQPVDCGQNLGFLSGTLVTGAVYLVISPLESLSGSRGMLTPSIVFAYCVWLCWSAISAQPNFACNPVPPNSSNTGAFTCATLLVPCAAVRCVKLGLVSHRPLPKRQPRSMMLAPPRILWPSFIGLDHRLAVPYIAACWPPASTHSHVRTCRRHHRGHADCCRLSGLHSLLCLSLPAPHV